MRKRPLRYLAAVAVLGSLVGLGIAGAHSKFLATDPGSGCIPATAPSGLTESSPGSAPVVREGHLLVTEANNKQSFTVPESTIVDIELVNLSYGPWSIPESVPKDALERISASSRCAPLVIAGFLAHRTGAIHSARGNKEITQDFDVAIRVETQAGP